MGIRLILVRHGLSSFNSKGLIQGRTDDSYLTDEGYEQALKAGEALSNIKFNTIYSSPLSRASETAKTIKKRFKEEYNIIYDKNLLEVDLSSWSGLTINEIKTKYPEVYPIWKNDPENLTIQRSNNNNYYQPIQDLFNQSDTFIKDLLEI